MNTQTQEALKMAIEALLYGTDHTNAVKACKEALEQPAQEPVAWVSQGGVLTEARLQAESWVSHGGKATPLYTHPHQWQGLTDDEIKEIWLKLPQFPNHFDISRAIEQALKEKNHG